MPLLRLLEEDEQSAWRNAEKGTPGLGLLNE